MATWALKRNTATMETTPGPRIRQVHAFLYVIKGVIIYNYAECFIT